MLIISDDRCRDYQRPQHPESPQRVIATVELLRSQTDLVLNWSEPRTDPSQAIAASHSPAHLAHLAAPEEDFDADTPAYEDIDAHARRSVSGALDALAAAEAGEPALSLLRPPGHHASTERAMGFCYLNQAAIAAISVADQGRRVAVFDFDVHHGNGTELMLMGRPETLYASVHQAPAFPGTGSLSRMNCKNFPVRPYASAQDYVDNFDRAFDAMMAFNPEVLIVSAGFDSYRGDPLAQENVEGDDFFDFGRKLAATGLPIASILEGGYSRELPQLILEYLKGLDSGRR